LYKKRFRKGFFLLQILETERAFVEIRKQTSKIVLNINEIKAFSDCLPVVFMV